MKTLLLELSRSQLLVTARACIGSLVTLLRRTDPLHQPHVSWAVEVPLPYRARNGLVLFEAHLLISVDCRVIADEDGDLG